MSKDRCTISIPTRCYLSEIAKLQLKKITHNKKRIATSNRSRYFEQTYHYDYECYHIELLCFKNYLVERVLIHFSISKLLNGSNCISMSNIDENKLYYRIQDDLKHVLNFDMLQGEWSVSKDETNLDIIGPQPYIQALFEYISKASIPYRKIDLQYKKKGTIYFYSATDKGRSGNLIAIYDKAKECKDRGESNEFLEHIARNGYGIIRLENKARRRYLKRRVCKNKTNINNNMDNISMKLMNDYYINNTSHNFKEIIPYEKFMGSIEFIQYKYGFYKYEPMKYVPFFVGVQEREIYKTVAFTKHLNTGKAIFTDILQITYQAQELQQIIRNLGLDKEILTREELISLIQKDTVVFKTKKSKETAIRVVRFLNKEIKKQPPISSIKAYTKKILKLNVNYIYAPIHIKAFDINEIRSCLFNNTNFYMKESICI